MPPERNVSAPPRFVCEWSHRLYHEQSLCGIETVMCLHRLQPAHSLRHCCTADVQSTSASPPSVQLPCLAFSDKQPESAGVLPQYPALAAASQLALSAALGAGSAWLMSVGLMASVPVPVCTHRARHATAANAGKRVYQGEKACSGPPRHSVDTALAAQKRTC